MERTRRHLHACLWRRLDQPGFERCELVREAAGWSLRGTVLALEEDRSAEARYQIFCDEAWRTIGAEVELRDLTGVRTLRLEVRGGKGGGGRWLATDSASSFQAGREVETVRGAIDVDLGWSPSTNTFPIRRLNLEVGERSGPIVAAWVRFPELTVEPLPQEYERLAARRYRYTSAGGRFTTEIEVDEEGLVVDYGGIWRREGKS
jgi:uncharacterized protein